MPRGILKDPDRTAKELLFGTALQPVSAKELSKRTGISESTLSGYKKRPGTIPLKRLSAIIRCRGLTEAEIGTLMKAYSR